jgi:hypothetical protein
MPMLLVEVTRAWEAAATAEATRVMVVLPAWDSATLLVKDVEDWATLEEREALERVPRVEVENAATLASAHEYAEGFVWKIALLEGELVADD